MGKAPMKPIIPPGNTFLCKYCDCSDIAKENDLTSAET